jgi:hypothetical protein
MKKLTFGCLTILVFARAFGQGQLIFNNHMTGTLITHVYAPLSTNPYFQQAGNGSADTPLGSHDWSAFTPIGANGTGGAFGAATTFAQLLGANGAGQPEGSLRPALPTTTFRTGALAGYVALVTSTFSNIPWDVVAATIEMVAWDNSSGLYPIWTEAAPAWRAGLIAAGGSGLWTQPIPIQPEASLWGGVSFNLYYIPEPSCIGIAALAATCWLRCWQRCQTKRYRTYNRSWRRGLSRQVVISPAGQPKNEQKRTEANGLGFSRRRWCRASHPGSSSRDSRAAGTQES